MDWPDSPSSMEVDGDDTSSNMLLQVPQQKTEEVSTPLPAKVESGVGLPPTTQSDTTAPIRGMWAVPKREKISFSMGYRADCEKCQMKVPGHYSHIVRS